MRTKTRLGIAAGLLAVLAAGPAARAAVQVGLAIEHKAYLRFESIRATVTVYNDTDEPFILDGLGTVGASKLYFEVRRGSQMVAPHEGEPRFERLLVLPDETRTVSVDLCDAYPLSREGRYFIKAVASLAGEAWESNEHMLDIVPGIPLREVTRPVSGYPDRLRTFSLRYWTRDRKEYLFLTVNEQKRGYNYGVFQLGKLVRVRKPVIAVDRRGNVTVRHQCGDDRYLVSYLRSTRDEVVLVRQSYEHANGTPYEVVAEEAPEPLETKAPKRWWQFWRWFEPSKSPPPVQD